MRPTRGSQRIALIAVFASITTILDAVITPGFSSGIWYGWAFVMSPINGMVLGAGDGFTATIIAVLMGHTLVFRDSIYEFIFTLGAPLGSVMAGLVFRGRRRWAVAYYAVLLGAYFMSRVARSLPIWGMWDVYLAFVILLGATIFRVGKGGTPVSNPMVETALAALIGLEADILFRIFVLIPLRGYELFYGLTPELLAAIWSLPAPLITPIKVGASLLISALLVPSILKTLKDSSFSAQID